MIRRSKTAWQLQTAKARFSELFRLARSEGPQYVTKAGKEAVVIVPAEHYDELITRSRQPQSLLEFFRSSSLYGVDLDLSRESDLAREIEL
jgi:prevent-host-death family protein